MKTTDQTNHLELSETEASSTASPISNSPEVLTTAKADILEPPKEGPLNRNAPALQTIE